MSKGAVFCGVTLDLIWLKLNSNLRGNNLKVIVFFQMIYNMQYSGKMSKPTRFHG